MIGLRAFSSRRRHLQQEPVAGGERAGHPAGAEVGLRSRGSARGGVPVWSEGGALVSSLREWVLKSGMLIAMSVYTYLRLIVDHGTPNLLPLRQKEVDFCTSMIREKVRERRGGRAGAGGCCWSLSVPSPCPVHGVPDHRQRPGPPAPERSPDPGDGADLERLAAQPTGPQPSVHR